MGRVPYIEENLENYYLGAMDSTCRYRKAFYFQAEITKEDETFIKCFIRGKYLFDFNFEVPDSIKKLICNAHQQSKHFRENIRHFNSALAFASFGASVSTGNVQNVSSRGFCCFKVQGIIQHLSR